MKNLTQTQKWKEYRIQIILLVIAGVSVGFAIGWTLGFGQAVKWGIGILETETTERIIKGLCRYYHYCT